MALGKCTNFDECDKAINREEITVPDGADFVCPDCGGELMPVKGAKKPPIPLIAGIVLAVAVVGGGLGWVAMGTDDSGAGVQEEQVNTATVGLDDETEIEETTETETAPPPEEAPAPEEPAVSEAEVRSLLKAGNFAVASQMVQDHAEAFPEIRRAMALPVNPVVRLQYKKKGHQQASQPVSLDQPQLGDLRLSHEDNYRVLVDIPPGAPPVHLYVFQQDHFGKIERIFPDPVFGGAENPLAGAVTLRLPPKESDWFYLDELASGEADAIPETLYVIASPWEAEDLDELFGRLHQEMGREERSRILENFVQRLRVRDQAGLASVFFQEFTFDHVRPGDQV